MFIKSQSNGTIINFDRVCFIRKWSDYCSNNVYPKIEFYYSGTDCDFWKYNSVEERDEEFKKIEKLLNVIQFN